MAGNDQPRKKWILNAFSMSTPGHVSAGLWRHPRNRIQEITKINYWTDLAKTLDGNFHGLFLADMLGIYDVYKGPGNLEAALPGGAQWPMNDPYLPIAAMAAVTKTLSFGITASTTYENPFLLARRFGTLDHLTNGRCAWNIVTSFLLSAAKNLGLDEQVAHADRYEIAKEYLLLFTNLLEGSWRDDAAPHDLKTGEFTVPGRIRRIDHVGKYFKCQGPHLVEPSKQRTPLLFQAGASKNGMPFAAMSAEVMFLPGMDTTTVFNTIQNVKKLATEAGRDPANMRFIVGMLVVVEDTDEKAREKYEEYLSYVDIEGSLALIGGWTGMDLGPYADDDDLKFDKPAGITSVVNAFTSTIPGSDGVTWTKRRLALELGLGGPHPKAIGSPTTVVDELQRWVDETGVDGFNISAAVSPGCFEDVIKWVIPELKKRGLFWDPKAAEGKTMRENYLADGLGPRLRDDHPGSKYKWPSPDGNKGWAVQ